MSAEVLRKAAALMRERAEAATPSPWGKMRGLNGEQVVAGSVAIVRMVVQDERANMRHVASWHPAVALTVADWLEEEAQDLDAYCADETLPFNPHRCRQALAVARAYLGDES